MLPSPNRSIGNQAETVRSSLVRVLENRVTAVVEYSVKTEVTSQLQGTYQELGEAGKGSHCANETDSAGLMETPSDGQR